MRLLCCNSASSHFCWIIPRVGGCGVSSDSDDEFDPSSVDSSSSASSFLPFPLGLDFSLPSPFLSFSACFGFLALFCGVTGSPPELKANVAGAGGALVLATFVAAIKSSNLELSALAISAPVFRSLSSSFLDSCSSLHERYWLSFSYNNFRARLTFLSRFLSFFSSDETELDEEEYFDNL